MVLRRWVSADFSISLQRNGMWLSSLHSRHEAWHVRAFPPPWAAYRRQPNATVASTPAPCRARPTLRHSGFLQVSTLSSGFSLISVTTARPGRRPG